jgi:hypothetical protein
VRVREYQRPRPGYEGSMYIGLGTVVLILVIVVIVLMLRRGAV